MSQTVIFLVGTFVFFLTIAGVVIAGGMWLQQLAELEDTQFPASASTAGEPADLPHDPTHQ